MAFNHEEKEGDIEKDERTQWSFMEQGFGSLEGGGVTEIGHLS